MRKLSLFTLLILLLSINALSQKQNYSILISEQDDGTCMYMRSSLEMVYIDSEYFPNKEIVDESWNNFMDPQKNFPCQYNKHGANVGVVNLPVDPENVDEMTRALTVYINRNKIGNQLVKRWFNYNPYGKINYDIDYPENPEAVFNMQTVFERGYYTVNAGDENVSMSALKRDRDMMIKDLSMKLLPFTFMTFTKLSFVENEPVAAAVRDAAIIAARMARDKSIEKGSNPNMANMLCNIAETTAVATYLATKDGYTLKSYTWLYRLVWNEETERYFNEQVIKQPDLINSSNMFKMEFVDCQQNSSVVLISANKSFAEILDLAMVRNLNHVFKKLQDRNDVFKVWTPILDFYSLVSPNLTAPIKVENGVITAEIGTKEGLRGGEVFTVVDEDGNFYGYAEVKADKIWDNDEGFGMEASCYYKPQIDKKGEPVTATTFKGKKLKNARTGLLLVNPKPGKKQTITARIGTKEGVEAGDKFSVYQYDMGTKTLVSKGRVKVVKGKVWDNYYYNNINNNPLLMNNEQRNNIPLKERDKDGLKNTATQFKGRIKVQPGMFLRKEK
ncbi:MAG: hypothetical protein ACI358_09590 [Candidatus Limimorpha sp.]